MMENEEEINKKIEGELDQWYNDARDVLEDVRRIPARCEFGMIHVTDEIVYWETRFMTISSIISSLKYKTAIDKLEILRHNESAYIELYDTMLNYLEEASAESRSNVDFLQVLRRPCEDLYEVETIDDIKHRVPDILKLFLFVVTESPHYNEPFNFDQLCDYLGNQIVFQCRRTIDIGTVLDTDAETVVPLIRACVKCTENFIAEYKHIVHIINERESTTVLWTKAKTPYEFIGRCDDLQNLLKALGIFKRSDENSMNSPQSKFSVLLMQCLEKDGGTIERNFDKIMDDLKKHLMSIFDVTDSDWTYHINIFQNKLNYLCKKTEELTENALDMACNEIDSMDILQSLHRFFDWNQLRTYLQRKIQEVYKDYAEHLTTIVESCHSYNLKTFPYMPKYSSVCITAIAISNTVEKLKLEIVKRPCLLANPISAELNKIFDFWDESYRGVISKTMDSFWDKVDTKFKLKLDKNILTLEETSNGSLVFTVNLDSLLQCSIAEIKYVNLIKHPIPMNYIDFTKMSRKVEILHRNVTMLVKYFNYTVTDLSNQEAPLFNHAMHVYLKTIISKLSYKYIWSQPELVNKYLVQCYDALELIEDTSKIFKLCNAEISELCENIKHSLLVDKERAVEMIDIKDITNQANEHARVTTIIKHYNEIVRYVIIIYERFEHYIHHMKPLWTRYVDKIDQSILEALRVNVKSSMENILLQLRKPTMISMGLEESRVEFVPNMEQLKTYFKRVHLNIRSALIVVPRLHQTLKIDDHEHPMPFAKALANDQTNCDLQKDIVRTIDHLLKEIEVYKNNILTYSDIWSLDKHEYMDEFKAGAPTAENYDQKIIRYTEKIAMFELAEIIVVLPCAFIRIDGIMKQIVQHCHDWIDHFAATLLAETADMIDNFYAYMEANGIRVMLPPGNLIEMVEYKQYQEQLISDRADKQEEIGLITDNISVLKKHRIKTTKEMEDRYASLWSSWIAYTNLLHKAEIMLKEKQSEFKAMLQLEQEKFKIEVQQFRQIWEEFKETESKNENLVSVDALNGIRKIEQKYEEMKQRENQLIADLMLFKLKHYRQSDKEILEEIKFFQDIFTIVYEWDTMWSKYKTDNFWDINISELEVTIQSISKELNNSIRLLKDENWIILEVAQDSINIFRRVLPLISDLKNPAMYTRHWDEVREVVHVNFSETDPSFTLEYIMQMKMQKYGDQISEISKKAKMELNIENSLKAIKEVWNNLKLNVEPHNDSNIYRIKASDDIISTLEDHLVQLYFMKGSKYISIFSKEADYWTKALSLVMDVLEMTLSVQRQYAYEENIFKGDDVRKEIPNELKIYNKITEEWGKITSKMFNDNNVFRACHSKSLLQKLNKIKEQLEEIQKALELYMETKRKIFPRFYFISNDDLLDILAKAKNPDLLQPHLKKCFDNVNRIKVEDSKKMAEGMYSADGEYVAWSNQINCNILVEQWFNNIESMMRVTLKEIFQKTLESLKKNAKTRDKWILLWPGQLCITASQVEWTANCTKALVQSKTIGSKKPLKRIRRKQRNILIKFSDALRGDLAKIDRLKIVALVTIEIHARDVIEKMYKSNCMDESDFEWISQLRFYWDDEKKKITIRQTNTEQRYGYEYLGNSGRLVITPLTDRCYITLTTALHLFRGGSPKGPAGTGKTETVKDLGKNLAYYVIVINCSDGLDYKSMGRMFSGLAQQGAWGCFDEFNRINIEVLSVVAQQILSIYTALASGLRKFVFDGDRINLVPTCGIFITMNPGYAGRTELPDNLKSLFRAISMMVPDTKLIAEIMLFGEGFRDTRNLANKVYVLFLLCRQQLSKQDHYEFGLRGLVALLRYAGQCRRQHPQMFDNEVLLLAMHNMNLAKLTVDDLPLFMGITKDLFPKIILPVVKNDVLVDAIKRCMLKNNHQPSDSAIAKVVQLYETKVSRHSVMILGQTGAAKTSTWKTLRDSMILLKKENVDGFETVIEYPLNPKALTLGELYGEYNLSTQDWSDGVLSSLMRITCSDSGIAQKWIIFDGPVDAVWIENMNSVMDDNKVLTLINSERITMPEQVSLLFEVEDLAVASPATVSRCGIVYNDYKDFGWKLYVESWLSKCKFEPYRDNIRTNFQTYIDVVLEFKRSKCTETVPLPELSAVQSLCKLLECFTFDDFAVEVPNGLETKQYNHLLKLWFLFCMVWSVCAVVNESGRKKIDHFLRSKLNEFPVGDSVYHYYVDAEMGQFRHWDIFLRNENWSYKSDLPFFKIIVPTVDTVRYNYLVAALTGNQRPVLLVGPVGTGKTSTVQKVLDAFDKNKFLILTINMSAQTTVHNIQETLDGRLEKRTKDLYMPLANKTMITFLDDLNMPEKEVYGAQPPLELIRQWMDYGFWFDRTDRSLKNVKNMVLIGAMGPPGGGRNTISNRLTSRFSMVNLTFPEESQISYIFNSMLNQHMKPFEEYLRNMRFGLTEMTIALYKAVVANLLPTPTKMHYLFNLRDISKVFQGLLRSSVSCQKNVESMLRLWCNEVFRVFNDKLIDEKDREWFLDQINAILGKHYEQTYRNLCPSDHALMFCDFLNKQSVYEEVTDEKYLRQFIYDSLDEYNSNAGVVPLSLVLFKDAINHVCRINRVISQPRGYILLVGIGGSGRSSLARVANWLCGYNMFTIELTKSYGVSDFKEDLKRLYYDTGVRDLQTSFLFNDTQIANEVFLEIINNILSTGEVSKLYKDEDFEEIKEALSVVAKKAGVPETTDGMYSFFLDRVRGNLHIIICLSPIGNKFRIRLRQYPSLINCTTIDWFLDWPKEALLEVAFRSLSTIEILETITGYPRVYEVDSDIRTEKELKLSIANLFSIIHHSVANYSNIMLLELKRYNYVTPTNYLELVSGYKESLRLKRIEVANIANKLRNGLFKIDSTSKKVAGMTTELEKATETVTKYTEECDEFLHILTDQTTIADKKKKEVDEQSITIKHEEIKSQELYSLAVADLEKAMPALEEAMEALNALNKKDLAEVKSFSTPPPRVKLVLEALMILKQSEPSWTEAKRQLGDPNFLTQLKDFDKDHVPPKVLKKIGAYTRNPEFEPEKVGAQSIAAKSLAQWVIAIEKYAIIFKDVAPKKASADAALESLKNKQLELFNAQNMLLELQKLLLKLENDFDKKMKEKEQLVKKAEDLKRNLERAASLIEGLSGENVRWTETVKQLDRDFDYLPGDCLIGIAFVSYMGPFVFKYRDILLKLWTQSVRDMKIPSNPDYEIKTFLSDPAIIRNWNIHGLPNDDLSTENGIIISRGSRWPLIIDPQCQALRWIKKMEADNKLQLIDFCLPNYMKILENALSLGYPTLLQITSENIDPAVMPVLSKSIVKEGGQLYIKMGDKLLPYNDNFRFFITTKIRNPYYPPEIFTRAAVINFAIKEEGLEDQLLDVVIKMEKPKLKILKDSLIINIANGKKTLVELEDELLRLLNEIEGSLLENDELFNTLASSKITSANINEQLENSLTTQSEIDYAREGYRSCAKRASILFFVLNELNQIDPMYQFSLDSYMDLFQNSIRKSEKHDKLDQRLENLNYYHTYAVYQNTCRGLFEIHKLLFSFQICISLLLADDQLPMREIEFLFKGGIVLNKVEQTENPCKSWLPASNWDNITELDKMSGFLGIEKSFEQFPREWKEWYMSPYPETLSLVGKWNDNTNEFQKLLFVRSLRLDRLSFAISNFIASKLSPRFIEPPVLDVRNALEDSSNKTPLIFLLSPGVDPTSMLLGLAANTSTPTNLQSLSLGQGQAPIATKLIEEGQKHGYWVFLANCHLSLSWMPQLDKIVELMQDGESHSNFRLWLSSNPNPDFPIAILQSAIKMTTEPPKGLKANMKRLFNNITNVQYSKCASHEKYTKLLFSLCFFHSILIERKKFQNLGWNVIYSFNDSDFVVSENLLSIYLDTYTDTPWDALKYLIAGICYGGQVTDDWDRRLLDTYINQYFNENVITTPYYRLSSLLKYYIPVDTDLQSQIHFIDTLPNVDGPEVFGQHSNAEMASLMEANRMVCDTLLALQGQSSSVAEENKEEKVLVLCSEILKKIPDLIDYDATVNNIGAKRGPLNVVLLQEIVRYNILLKEIKKSLVGLEKGIKGLVVMSSDLEEVFQCVYDGRVPGQWLKAYPSLMNLGSWTQDLIKRINHFTVWADRVHPPVLFWLGAYTYPTSFLTAVLQVHSRNSSVPIDLLNWDFTPITIPEIDIVMPPQDGVYVRNLYLEGANWNFEKSCICEPVPLKFIAQLPVIQFKPVVSASKKRGYYQCPVYYYPQRSGTQGRDAFVVVMNLSSGTETPDYWVKKATAVLLNLSF